MAKKRGFRIDLHVHSKYSGESLAEPKEILESALDKGLDGICITEHGSLYASRPFEELKKNSSLVIFRGLNSQQMQAICLYMALRILFGTTGENTGL